MKKKSHKAWLLNGSMIAAFIAAVIVFVVMLQLEKNVLTQYERGAIIVATKEIPKGMMITEDNAEEYFEQREMEKSCIPPTALQDMKQVQGLVPVYFIEKGVLLTKGMFEDFQQITSEMKKPVIAGFKAEDMYQLVGGTLRPGDRIHIYSVDKEGIATLIWSDVFVQQVFDSTGKEIASSDCTTAAQRVNVYLDKSDVERFYSELTVGSLRAVKVCD